ncbi:MAG: decaprenyl-phosphate phosphoribosyltransferase [Ignavibacteriales bacterium]|nr:decaprenyl-phosphate phosphoribosyltransferase [Ignavibacteriales bacterium]
MKKPWYSNISFYIKLIRVTSWPKNFFVFVPAVFSKHIFSLDYFLTVLLGFFTFSIASSAVYVFNDIIDAPKDKFHPLKKNRPIASGIVSKFTALIISAIFFLTLAAVTLQMSLHFSLIIWAYVIINIFYTTYLKEVVIVDIFCVASGFMLRVIAGAFLISVVISNWLILTTMFLSLFLAVMKRRVEIANSANPSEQRKVLKDYSINFIDQIAAMTGSGVILSYALYSVADRTVNFFGSENLVFTTTYVIFGIFRYMYLVYKKDKGENVIEVLMTDIPMIINLILYIATTVFIIYSRQI